MYEEEEEGKDTGTRRKLKEKTKKGREGRKRRKELKRRRVEGE